MKERNLLASFVSVDDAQEAEKALNQAGFSITQVDSIRFYPGEGPRQTMNPLTGDFPGLGYLTLDADFNSVSAGILAATDPSASGMSDGDGMMPEANRNVLLTAVVPEEQAEQAIEMIRQYGGEI